MRQGTFTPKTNDPEDARRRAEIEREIGQVATRVFTSPPDASQIRRAEGQPILYKDGAIYYLGFMIDGALRGVALTDL